ncbi:MAG: hypothetical protein JWN40_3934 [Phycisphaerales bacterium]|nr:hypothetical protein [Phycisphaerales bacterium]
MTTEIRAIYKVRSDGSIVVPVGVEEAGNEVEVTVTPRRLGKRASEMTPAEYAAFIDGITGKWVGEFPDIEDVPPEERDPL